MNRRRALLIVVLLLVCGFCWIIFIRLGGATSNVSSLSSNAKPAATSELTSPDDSNPDAGPAARPKRPPLQKKESESDKLYQELEADGPEVTRSVVHAVIPEGKSMVTGGYLTADGFYEFCVVSPKWINLPGQPRQILLATKTFRADPKALEKSGLQSLVTPDQKSSQNAEVWGPEDIAATLAAGEGGVTVKSSPTIITEPGSPVAIHMSDPDISGNEAFGIQLEAGEAPGVGFELKSDLRHMK